MIGLEPLSPRAGRDWSLETITLDPFHNQVRKYIHGLSSFANLSVELYAHTIGN